MSNIHQFADFTLLNYRRLVQMARRTYAFRRFTEYRKEERFVLWRHDVDMSVHAARRLAQIEADEGVRTTYFLHIHSPFYNLLEPVIVQRIRDIVSFGHDLGLHFDAGFAKVRDEDELVHELRREKELLEKWFGEKISAFSFHNPGVGDQQFRRESYAGMVNAYSDYLHKNAGYVSDSNGYWRHRRLEDVLSAASDPALQVLTHPEWWQEAPMPPRERVERCISGRAEAVRRAYDEELEKAGRLNLRS